MLKNKNKIVIRNSFRTKKLLTAHCSLLILLFIAHCSLLIGCTFDYGESEASDDELPNLVMENVEYIRIRSADPQARFFAERAERFENQGVMKLQNFTFEQYGDRGEEVNSKGSAGFASININTTDIFMDNGVRIEVDTDDIIIETNQLEWKDEDRVLFTPEDEEVNIYQDIGTSFMGIGLHVDARSRRWKFFGDVSGVYYYEDEEDDDEGNE